MREPRGTQEERNDARIERERQSREASGDRWYVLRRKAKKRMPQYVGRGGDITVNGAQARRYPGYDEAMSAMRRIRISDGEVGFQPYRAPRIGEPSVNPPRANL